MLGNIFGGMFGLLWEGRRQQEIADTKAEARRVSSHAREAIGQVTSLEDRFDRLLLICMGLWSLLKERTDLTEEELMEKVKEIDLADGREDGKLKKLICRCASCNRVMSHRHTRCLYCGAAKLNTEAFDAAF